MRKHKKKIKSEFPSLVNLACKIKDFLVGVSLTEFPSDSIMAVFLKAKHERHLFEVENIRIDDNIDLEAGKMVFVIEETGEIFIKTKKQHTPYYDDKCTPTINIPDPSCGSGLITRIFHAGRDVFAYAWNTNVTSRPSDLKQQTHLYNNKEDEISERKKKRRQAVPLGNGSADCTEMINQSTLTHKHACNYGK